MGQASHWPITKTEAELVIHQLRKYLGYKPHTKSFWSSYNCIIKLLHFVLESAEKVSYIDNPSI